MKYIFITIALLFLFALDIFLGSISISFDDLTKALIGADVPESIKAILWNYRIPKAITATLAGVALSLAGLQMQTLFRNPLADPFILGISAGAGFGVALFIMGASAFGYIVNNIYYTTIGSAASGWIGALVVTFLILWVAEKLKENLTILIFGIMLSSILTAVINLLQYYSSESSLKVFVLWTMGSFAGLTYTQLAILSIVVITGVILTVFNIKDLNAIIMGENYAKSLGVDLRKVRIRILASVTILAGGVTALCGPIGFIGIAVPHIARIFFKNGNHKILVPASALAGAALMLLTDIISQVPGKATVIPINTVSALIGVPVIIYIIFKKRIN